MKPEQVQLIGNLVSLFLQYGIPAVMGGIAALGKEEIANEDIAALKAIIQPPEMY